MPKMLLKKHEKASIKNVKPAKGKVAAPAVKKAKEEVQEEEKPFNLSKVYGRKLDELEKEYNLTSSEIDVPGKLSTTNLMLDLLTSGGIMSGTIYQWSGVEQGSKTTGALTTFGNAIRTGVPINVYQDAENAVSDIKYTSALLKRDSIEVFEGEDKLGRLYRKSVLEPFFNYCRALMRSVPDKIYRGDLKQWFFVFDDTKLGRQMMSDFGYTKYDKDLYKVSGRLWCPTDQKGLQGFIVCDSFAALSPQSTDEKDTGGGRASQARAFSESLMKITGIMKEKAFSLLGTHQVREKPEASYGHGGPQYYESGGNALKFYSSNRVRFFTRSVPEKLGWAKGIGDNGYPTGDFGAERSFYGEGQDRYHYIYFKNTKNKLGTPKLEGWARVWVKDGEGNPHGYCPAFDTFQYLDRTGRIEKVKKKGMKQAFMVNIPQLQGKVLDFQTFKLMILANEDPKLAKYAKIELGGNKLPEIRKELFKEIRTKKAYKMIEKKAKESKEDDNEDLEAEE